MLLKTADDVTDAYDVTDANATGVVVLLMLLIHHWCCNMQDSHRTATRTGTGQPATSFGGSGWDTLPQLSFTICTHTIHALNSFCVLCSPGELKCTVWQCVLMDNYGQVWTTSS